MLPLSPAKAGSFAVDRSATDVHQINLQRALDCFKNLTGRILTAPLKPFTDAPRTITAIKDTREMVFSQKYAAKTKMTNREAYNL